MRKQTTNTAVVSEHNPDWLRKFKGYEHYTDEQAMDELRSLDLLADILLGISLRK